MFRSFDLPLQAVSGGERLVGETGENPNFVKERVPFQGWLRSVGNGHRGGQLHATEREPDMRLLTPPGGFNACGRFSFKTNTGEGYCTFVVHHIADVLS